MVETAFKFVKREEAFLNATSNAEEALNVVPVGKASSLSLPPSSYSNDSQAMM